MKIIILILTILLLASCNEQSGSNNKFVLGDWVSIGTLDTSTDNSNGTDIENNLDQNNNILENIDNYTNEEKQDLILYKTILNNNEVERLKWVYLDKLLTLEESISWQSVNNSWQLVNNEWDIVIPLWEAINIIEESILEITEEIINKLPKKEFNDFKLLVVSDKEEVLTTISNEIQNIKLKQWIKLRTKLSKEQFSETLVTVITKLKEDQDKDINNLISMIQEIKIDLPEQISIEVWNQLPEAIELVVGTIEYKDSIRGATGALMDIYWNPSNPNELCYYNEDYGRDDCRDLKWARGSKWSWGSDGSDYYHPNLSDTEVAMNYNYFSKPVFKKLIERNDIPENSWTTVPVWIDRLVSIYSTCVSPAWNRTEWPYYASWDYQIYTSLLSWWDLSVFADWYWDPATCRFLIEYTKI